MVVGGAIEEVPVHLAQAGDGQQFLLAQTALAEGQQRQRAAHQVAPVILLVALQHAVEEVFNTLCREVEVDAGVEPLVAAEAYQLVEQGAQHQGVLGLGV